MDFWRVDSVSRARDIPLPPNNVYTTHPPPLPSLALHSVVVDSEWKQFSQLSVYPLSL